MRTIIFFLFTVFTSTLFMLSGMMPGPTDRYVIHTLVGLGLWALFFLYCWRLERKRRISRRNEELFHQFMRDHIRRR